MAITEPGTILDPAEHSEALAFYYNNAKEHILKHPAAVDWDLIGGIRTYTDPALKVPAAARHLAVRLWDAGMLAPLEEEPR
eukprot:13423938-Alexandrium_andersonii.AAC.1